MFKKNPEITSLETRLAAKETEITRLKEELRASEISNKESVREQETKIKLLEMQIDIKVSEKVKQTVDENNALKQENAVMKKEISILEKAFENMGFDVKDMKDILDQLVKGIVSKNTVTVVK